MAVEALATSSRIAATCYTIPLRHRIARRARKGNDAGQRQMGARVMAGPSFTSARPAELTSGLTHSMMSIAFDEGDDLVPHVVSLSGRPAQRVLS